MKPERANHPPWVPSGIKCRLCWNRISAGQNKRAGYNRHRATHFPDTREWECYVCRDEAVERQGDGRKVQG